MLRVFAHNPYNPFASYYLAFITYFFNRTSDFHIKSLTSIFSFMPSFYSIYYSASGQVVW